MDRCEEYLSAGGLFNPELMDHEKVRDIIVDLRDLISQKDIIMQGWIGVDLDGTLAKYDGWVNETHIGEPIPLMVERVNEWLAHGKKVKIMTARAQVMSQATHDAIDDWCVKNFGMTLEITCMKDMGMIELWDDRAVGVVPNTGRRADQEWMNLEQR